MKNWAQRGQAGRPSQDGAARFRWGFGWDVDASGDLRLRWIRRSRRGFAWIDGVDVPLGETSEKYRLAIIGSAGAIEFSAATSELGVPPYALVAAGAGPAVVQVRQVGDTLASSAEQLAILIP